VSPAYISFFAKFLLVMLHMTNSYTNFIFIVLCSVFKTWSAVSLSYFHIFRKNYFAISFENFQSFLDFWCNFIQTFILSRYMLAEGLGLSGIVSILFTGIVSGCALFFLYNRLLHIEAVLWKHWFFVLGHEALHILKFVGKVSKIRICIFSFDIIISRDICVRNLVIIFSLSSD
jgi:hypothetical protein